MTGHFRGWCPGARPMILDGTYREDPSKEVIVARVGFVVLGELCGVLDSDLLPDGYPKLFGMITGVLRGGVS